MLNKNILILTEAGDGIGMGHINRCCALADGFKWFSIEVDIYVRGSITSIEVCKNRNINYVDWFNEVLLNRLLYEYDIILVDSYLATDDMLKYITEKCSTTIFLIDATLRYQANSIVLFPSI